ncbi:MAG: TolC family protein [candidate division WOR-3 bacterium]
MMAKIMVIFFIPATFLVLLGESLDLNDLIDSALVYNLEIKAAQARYESSTQNSPFKTLMDPMFGIEFSNDMRMYSISQEFPFPTKLGSQYKIATTVAEKNFSLFEAKKNEVIKNVKELYGQLYIIRKEREIMERVKENLEGIHSVTMRNYTLNRVSQTDVLQVEIGQTKLENEILNIKSEETLILAKLNQLLGRNPDDELIISTEISLDSVIIDTDSLYALALRYSPILKSYFIEREIAQRKLSLSKQEYLPDFMVKFEQEEMDMVSQNRKIMVGLTFPLWFLGKQKKMVDQMKAEVKMIQAEYEAMELEVIRMIKELTIILDNYRREVNLYENSIIPKIESALKSAIRDYELNRVDIMTVLETQNMLIENELQYHRAKINYFITFAELERIIGTDL